MLGDFFAEAGMWVRHPGCEPHLVTSIKRSRCAWKQDAGARMRDDDWLPDAADLAADDLGVVIRSEFRLTGGEIDRMRAVPAVLERTHEALPACR